MYFNHQTTTQNNDQSNHNSNFHDYINFPSPASVFPMMSSSPYTPNIIYNDSGFSSYSNQISNRLELSNLNYSPMINKLNINNNNQTTQQFSTMQSLSEELSENEDDNPKKKRFLNSSQRVAANLREKNRMSKINEAIVDLKHKLPITVGRKRRKLSRLDTVNAAIEYISYLDSLLYL